MEKLKLFPYLQRTSVFLIGLTLFAAACNKPSEPSTDTMTSVDVADYPRLRPSDLYKPDSVNSFLNTYGTRNQELAEKFYAKFNELRKTDKDKATWTLKKGLTYYPLAMWYRELGDELLRSNNFNEAQDAYTIFLKSNPKPDPEQYLNIVKAALLADENSSRYDIGSRAMESGVTSSQFQALMKEEEVLKRLSQNEIKSYYDYITTGNSTSDTTLPDFKKFTEQFEVVNLPFRMDENRLSKHTFSEEYFDYDASRDFSKYQFERSEDMQFYPDYDFQYTFKTGNFSGFIYSADTSGRASTRQNRCLYHRLLVYDAEGKLAGTHVIGIHAGERLSTYEIKKDGKIEVYNFIREWKNPYNKNSPDNELLLTVPKDTLHLKITSEGTIE